jgi:mRNA interferase RelE/StbE
MTVEYLESFYKDLENIHLPSVKKAIQRAIENAQQANNLSELRQLKKLSGFSDAFRIRIGDYRIGLFINGDVVQFARIIHRKDIYRLFP